MNTPSKLFTLSLLVANRPGVLGRIALVFSRRGFNIETLNVKHTLDERFSRMVVVTKGEPKQLDDIAKQTRNLVDVMHFSILGNGSQEKKSHQVRVHTEAKKEVLGIVQQYGHEIVDFTDSSVMVRANAFDDEFEVFLEIVRYYGNIEQVPIGE